jgi:hypothetical protein
MVNGGIASLDEAETHLQHVDGVMPAAPPIRVRHCSPLWMRGFR